MSAPTALGIDVGTTNVKVALLESSPEPSVVAEAAVSHNRQTQSTPGHVEQDANQWWAATEQALRELGSRLDNVRSVSVSGQGSTFVLLDETHRAVAPAIGWQDLRAADVAEQLAARWRDALMAAHGNEIGDAPEPKLIWLHRERPAIVDAASVAVTAAGFVSTRLGATPALNEGDAGSWMSWNRNGRCWDQTLAAALGVGRVLPAVHAAGALLGRVCEVAAAATGIPRGVPIVASTTDVGAAAVASGVSAPGQVQYSKGTGGFLCLTSSPVASPGRLLALPFLQDGSVQLCAATDSLGAAWDWARQLLGDLTSEQAATLADAAAPGANGLLLLPWFQGAQHPLLEPRARGTITGLDLRTSRGDLLRGVLESTALMLRLHLREMKAVSGTDVEVIAASGGPTRNQLWNRLDAAAARTDIHVVDAGAAIGSGLLAGEYAGLWASAAAAGAALAHAGRRIAPEPELVRLLDTMEAAVDDVSAAALWWMPRLAEYRAKLR